MDLKNITDLGVKSLNNLINEKKNCKFIFLEKDENEREISIHKLVDVYFLGSNLFYPNIFSFSNDDKKYYKIINEKIMSLDGHINDKINTIDLNLGYDLENTPMFFFVYNTDNYYHFIYDTLPYLISYLYVKKHVPHLKLLMNYPTPQSKKFYDFVIEFLDILGIKNGDIEIISKRKKYNEVYISTSFTHDINSNNPPRKEIYDFYQTIVNDIKYDNKKNLKKIYVSRRTWLHNNFSNIGTNYTLRRKMENEDKLVDYLTSKGFVEVFTENLSTIEKLILFKNVTHVIGSIGGGLCNVLFSKKNTNLITIVSPTFLDVNKRFKYSLESVNVNYFDKTFHIENGIFKKYMRVSCPSKNIIGEISNITGDVLEVIYTDDSVSGWNLSNEFKKIFLNKNQCTPIDNGLNSYWGMDLNNFIEKYDKII